MKRSMRLTITMTTSDGVPEHPSRFGAVMATITRMLEQGARSGTIEHRFEFTQGGEPTSELAVIDFDVMPVKTGDAT